jgi:pyruvate ferredoxin oxidoreductase delta subunit
MAKPWVRAYLRPRSLADYPTGPCFTAGHLAETNASWRSERPVLTLDRCNACLRCYLGCPDGAIVLQGSGVAIDYDFCKGCGVCVRECSTHALAMAPENRKGDRK